MDDFSERLVLLCQVCGLRNVDVARKLGLDESSTSLWLQKKGKPRDRSAAVFNLFGLTLGEFYALDVEQLRIDAASAGGSIQGSNAEADA